MWCIADLKLDNFLIRWGKDHDDVREIKLTDFDYSVFCPQNELFTVSCGSPAYAAPELCIMDPVYNGRDADVWSIGILLYILVCGNFPWYDGDMLKLFRMIRNDPLQLPSHLSPEVKDLLQKILNKNPNDRFSISQILSHSWLCSQTIEG